MNSNVPIAAALVVVLALAASAAYVVLCTSDEGGNDGTVVEMDVTSVDNEKILALQASANKFNTETVSSDLLVYCFPLDTYIDANKQFDYTSFYNDMEKQGAYDENLGEYLPSNAKSVTDFSFEVTDSKNMTITFEESNVYDAYIVVLDENSVTDGQPISVSLYDLPEEAFTYNSPSITVENDIYRDMEGNIFILKASNTTFKSDISASSVTFSGSFSDLAIESVDYVDETTVSVSTSGYITDCTSSVGYIDLAADATECGYELSAIVSVQDSTFRVDETSFDIKDGILYFDIQVARGIYDNYEKLSFYGTEYTVDEIPSELSDDVVRLQLSIPTSLVSVDECVDAINGQSLVFTEGTMSDLDCTLCIPTTVVSGYVEKTKVKGDTLTMTIPLYTYSGYLEGLTSDMVDIACDYPGATCAISGSGDGYVLTVTVPGFDGTGFDGSITLTDGVLSPWGSDAGDASFSVRMVLGDSLSSDEMISALYKHMNFQKVMGKINIATAGIGAVVDILGATGVIDMRSATDIAVAEINLKCDEIKNMLADQSLQLEKMSKKLDEIQGMLKEQRLLDLSKIYHEYLATNNKLANDISTLSNDIKGDVWKLVRNETDGSVFVYVTSEGKLSIVQDGFYEQKYYGQTVDGKSFISEYTICIPLDYGSTFADANKGTGFSKDTESRMVACLKSYIDANDVNKTFELADGSKVSYTSDELAQQIYNCIVVNFTYERANGEDGKNILNDYYRFTETMASLVVSPSGDISISADLRSNPILASQEIMQSNYNFETEAHDYLKSLNDSTTMFLYSYTLTASGIEQLLGNGGTTVEKHYDATMKFLAGHRGYDLDSSVMHDYCYVTNTYLKAKEVTISVQATFHTTDGFKHNVSDSPTDITPLKTQQQLQIPAKYLNSDQLKKLIDNYNRLKSQKVTSLDLSTYLKNHTGCMFTGYVYNNLITSFDGGEIYNDGRHVKLYSNVNLVSPGHSAQLVDSGSTYEISGTIDKSGCFKQFKAYSSNVHGKIAYKGDLFNVKTGQFYDKVCNVHGYIYAVGFFSKHVHAWTNDEAAVLTPEKSVDNCNVGVSANGFNFRTYFVDVGYMVIQLT